VVSPELTSPAPGEDWRPNASLDVLRKRAQFLQSIRSFFATRDVLEVETPILSAAGNTSPLIDSFTCHYRGPARAEGQWLYLHTSPEFPMKRLLASGSGPIYQICKVFRNGEMGARHNPEFTMLEWYRPHWHYHQLMDEVSALVETVCGLPVAARISYADVFAQAFGVDVHVADVRQLRQVASHHGLDDVTWGDENIDFWRDLLMSHLIEPTLGLAGPVFVYDYPASQAALAQVRQGEPPLAERFELYWRGVELANGYQELLDGDGLALRMDDELQIRQTLKQPSIPRDERLLAAQRAGLPPCAGVALGVDRLFMLQQGLPDVASGISFAFERA